MESKFAERSIYDLKFSMSYRDAGNTRGFLIKAAIFESPGIVEDTDVIENRWVVLNGRVPLTFLKLQEASFFFDLFSKSLHNGCIAYFALLTSLRSVTFVLQKECAGKQGFADWYARKQRKMRLNPLLKALVDMRNESQKEGLEPPSIFRSFSIAVRENGEARCWSESKEAHITGLKIVEPVSSCRKAIKTVAKIVQEAESLGYLTNRDSSGQLGFAIGLFKQKGKNWQRVPGGKTASRRLCTEIERRFGSSRDKAKSQLPKNFQILGFSKKFPEKSTISLRKY